MLLSLRVFRAAVLGAVFVAGIAVAPSAFAADREIGTVKVSSVVTQGQ